MGSRLRGKTGGVRGNNGWGWNEDERGEGWFGNRPYQSWAMCRWFVLLAMIGTEGGNGVQGGDGGGMGPRIREDRGRGRAVREPQLGGRMLSGTGFTSIPRLHEDRL